MSVQTFVAGAAQHSYRDGAPHPAAAMAASLTNAIADAGLDSGDVDLLACVEPLSWNYEDLGAAVAAEAQLGDNIETPVGARRGHLPAGSAPSDRPEDCRG